MCHNLHRLWYLHHINTKDPLKEAPSSLLPDDVSRIFRVYAALVKALRTNSVQINIPIIFLLISFFLPKKILQIKILISNINLSITIVNKSSYKF